MVKKEYTFDDFLPKSLPKGIDPTKWDQDKKDAYLEFVLISVANHKGSNNESVRYVANYPTRGLTYAELSGLQKKRLYEAYDTLTDEEKTKILTVPDQRKAKSQCSVVWEFLKAFVKPINFWMGVGGSLILVILAFDDSMEHDTYNRLNQSSAILLFFFTLIGVFKDFGEIIPQSIWESVEQVFGVSA